MGDQNPKSHNSLSLEAAKQLRGGALPHVPPAASPVSTQVTLRLEAGPEAYPEVLVTDPRRQHGWRVALVEGGDGTWQAEVLLPQEPTVLTYYFVLRNGATVRERRQVEGRVEPLFGVWEEREFQLSVYDPEGAPPSWIPGTVMYQIFPDRFARGDPENVRKGGDVYGQDPVYLEWDAAPEYPPRGRDFFGGDLRGIIDKLDYLQDLGINCIYFNPIFASPTNHRYDATDYMRIDPRLGTEQDFRELVEKASERGIRIVLDAVFNHCSNNSIYFKAAQESKLSPYYRWFDFVTWPNRWVGWLGSRDRLATLGVNTMPEFVECPEVEEFFFGENGVALYWLSFGAAGWRTDVTPWITNEYWRRFRRAVRRASPEAYLISEDWANASHRLVGDTYDATMNYRFGYSAGGFARRKLTPTELDDRLETLRRDTPPAVFYAQMNLIDSHDTARILTIMEGSKERVMLAAALQLAYPGVPCIYYGSEAGIEGTNAEDGRRPFPWGAEDTELMTFYKRAIAARLNSPALSRGDVQTVWIDDRGGYGFTRCLGADTVVALFNNSAEPLEATVRLDNAPDGAWGDLLRQAQPARVTGGILSATLPPLGAAWFQAAPNEC